ncbi:PP2C family protein-serine/threonine phosphatase [Streptomyces sp. NPDC059989]|uniref:PP2C family protein-serine/threonine phosphatase n=1 Tax=Streptomyces sp. NPDC059989 TaxID=3347026 RepID=UPI0036A3DD0A
MAPPPERRSRSNSSAARSRSPVAAGPGAARSSSRCASSRAGMCPPRAGSRPRRSARDGLRGRGQRGIGGRGGPGAGDITGHDMHASTIMGQVRSMLRQATLDHPPYSPVTAPPYSPFTALTALDAACSALPMETSGTLVHARLDPVDGSPDWTLTWSNADHPRPLLRTPDGHVTQLVEHDVLLHRSLGPFDRTEHRRPLPPGSTLLLYTDGLVKRRGHDMDAAVAQLIGLLARHGHRPLDELLRRIINRLADPAPEDDVVLLSVRTPAIAQP